MAFDPVGGAKKGATPTETAGQFFSHPRKSVKKQMLEYSNFL